MKTLLLSGKAALQFDLEGALDGLDEHAEVWRTPVLNHAVWFLARDTDVDVVFIDVGWCGPQALPAVIEAIDPWLGDAKVVLLVRQLEDFNQAGLRRVRADLCVPRATPRRTFCSLLATTVWGVPDPVPQRLAA